MPVNEISTGSQTQGQFIVSYQQNGNGGAIPVIDGKPEPSLMFGYSTDSDRIACLRVIENALRATNGNIPAARQYIYNAVTTAANNIQPDEAVDVDGTEMLIDYNLRKIYEGTEIVATLDDMPELPMEATKAMLIDRARIALAARQVVCDDFGWEDDEEYDE